MLGRKLPTFHATVLSITHRRFSSLAYIGCRAHVGVWFCRWPRIMRVVQRMSHLQLVANDLAYKTSGMGTVTWRIEVTLLWIIGFTPQMLEQYQELPHMRLLTTATFGLGTTSYGWSLKDENWGFYSSIDITICIVARANVEVHVEITCELSPW